MFCSSSIIFSVLHRLARKYQHFLAECLQLLDTHPDQRAVPAILGLLDDPVPRVRWHALHAVECDVCKGGESLLEDPILAKIRELAGQDENKRVRAYARRIADSQGPEA